MHPDGHVDSSRSFDEDLTMEIKCRFFFTRDVAKNLGASSSIKWTRINDDDSRISV